MNNQNGNVLHHPVPLCPSKAHFGGPHCTAGVGDPAEQAARFPPQQF